MSFYYSVTPGIKLQGKTLVLPVVSVANVPQLTVDLLIATLGLERIGLFDVRDLVPVVGAREDEAPGVTTPLERPEVYGKEGLDIVVIQQRSPVLKARKESFINSILNFIKDNKLSGVLLLTGVDLSNRSDSQMGSPVYKLIPPKASASSDLQTSAISEVNGLPTYSFAPAQRHGLDSNSTIPAPSLQLQNDLPFIPGGGLTRRLLSSLPPSWPIPIACILQFVLEGDNQADAEFLAGVVAKVLKLESRVNKWKQPRSWNTGLFGTPNDQTLYG